MIPTNYFLILSVVLFVLGAIAFFVKKDLITMFMSVEIMLNAANLAFITFARSANSPDGQIIVFLSLLLRLLRRLLGWLSFFLLSGKKRQSNPKI